MNEQFNSSNFVERTDDDTDKPVVNWDPFAEKVPMDASLIQDTPMDETVALVDPMDEPGVPEALVDEPDVPEAPVDETIVPEAPVAVTITHEAPIVTNVGSPAALLDREEAEHLRTRWNEIQGKFVDDPRAAVQQADALVSEVVEQITQMFAAEHSSLEGQWNQGNDVSTEDLRQALKHYRSFFNRLVV